MKELFSKKFWIAILVIAALIGSVVAVGAIEHSTNQPTEKNTLTTGNGSQAAEPADQSLFSRTRWLSDLMILSGKAVSGMRMMRGAASLPLMALLCLCLFALSWRLSIRVYEKREI